MIKLTPLFSGSRGNSTLIQTPHANILLDVGVGYRTLVARLSKCGLAPADITAIVITHEHTDHIAALKNWTKNNTTQIFVPKAAANFVAQNCWVNNIVEINGSFQIADAAVDVYRCSHDARACFGYRFSADGFSVASVTDTGVTTPQLVDFLAPCQTIALESNHDLTMLWNGNYPPQLKRRIASDLGHLSNNQAAEVLEKLVGSNVKKVVLAHLSQQNNTPQLAEKTITETYRKNNVSVGKDITVYVADQYENEVTL